MLGILILLEVLLAFIMGFANLIGMNTSLSFIMMLIINLIIFFGYGFKMGKDTNKKGLAQGLISGSIFILTLFLLSLIFYHKNITIGTLFYYVILLFDAMIASMIGKNKKIDSMPDKS